MRTTSSFALNNLLMVILLVLASASLMVAAEADGDQRTQPTTGKGDATAAPTTIKPDDPNAPIASGSATRPYVKPLTESPADQRHANPDLGTTPVAPANGAPGKDSGTKGTDPATGVGGK